MKAVWDKSKRYRILSVDGGGIRGLIAIYMLEIIEQKIKEKTADASAQLVDYFDLFVGSSTGSIIVAGLLCPDENGRAKYSPSSLRKFYMDSSKTIFKKSLWSSINYVRGMTSAKYSDKGLRKILDVYFKDASLKDLLKPCLITAYDIEARRNFFFRQHRAIHRPHYNFAVKDAVRSSSAAPVLFPIAEIRSQVNRVYHLIDGGVFAFNPSLCAYAEARHMYPSLYAKYMMMLSLGTGIVSSPIIYEKAKNWGGIEWMRPLHYITSEGMAESIDFQIKQMFLTCENKEQYLRINCKFYAGEDPRIDGCSQNDFAQLTNIAKDTARHFDQRIDKFVDSLIDPSI